MGREQWHDRWVTPFFTINPGAFRVGDERTGAGHLPVHNWHHFQSGVPGRI